MKKLVSHFIFCFSFITLFAQTHTEPCFYAHGLEAMEAQYPGYLEATRRTFDDHKKHNHAFGDRGVAKIPVVVHIVWKNDDENLPDSVVNQQIAILNQVFRRKNADTVNLRPIFKNIVGDAEIEFELKQIIRKKTDAEFQANILSLSGLDAVKQTAKGGSDAVDTEHFMNIWVCNVKPINILGSSSPLLGYAYPPANLKNWPANAAAPSKNLDGVVIWHKAFGGNKTLKVEQIGDVTIKGKTCVHEVGHYLGLRHIWGDGTGALLGGKDCNADDGVADTPKAGNQSQFNCDTTKNLCVDAPNDLPNMIENYMDYASESCTNSFTKGQIAIMKSVLAMERKGLLEKPTSAKEVAFENDFEVSPNPTFDYIQLKINDLSKKGRVEVYDALGKNWLTQSLQDSSTRLDISNLPSGIYFVKINDVSKKIVKK